MNTLINIKPTNRDRLEYTYGDLTIEIFEGDLLQQPVDMIVNPAHDTLQLIDGIGKAIKNKANGPIEKECENEYIKNNSFITDGHVFKTNSYLRYCKYVVHAVCPFINKYRLNEDTCYRIIENIYINTFNVVNWNNCGSLATTLLCSGTHGVPLDKCCEMLYLSLKNYVNNNSYNNNKSLRRIKIVNINKEINQKLIKYFTCRFNEESSMHTHLTNNYNNQYEQNYRYDYPRKNSYDNFDRLSLNEQSKLNNDNSKVIEEVEMRDDKLVYIYKSKNLRIEINKGDLLDQNVDTIVNSFDGTTLFGGKIGELISNKIGYKIAQTIENQFLVMLQKERVNRLEDGEIFKAQSYMNNCKNILHAVAPNSRNYFNNSEECFKRLETLFLNILMYGDIGDSIALPLLSSGINGVPANVCCERLYLAIEKYLTRITETRCLKLVKIVNIDSLLNQTLVKTFKERLRNDYKTTKECDSEKFSELNSYNYEHDNRPKAIKEPVESEFSNRFSTIDAGEIKIVKFNENQNLEYIYKSNGLEIQIFQGNLVELKLDAIVNAANPALQIRGMSGVTGAIDKNSTFELQRDCDDIFKKNGKRDFDDGTVIHTKSYMKNCEYVIHAVGPSIYNYKRQEESCYSILEETFFNIFMYSENNTGLNIRSIALPLISSGVFGVPKETCCERLFSALQKYVHKVGANNRLKSIKIPSIDYATNSEIVNYFVKKLKQTTNKQDRPSISTLSSIETIKEKNDTASFRTLEEKPMQVIKSTPIIGTDKRGRCIMCENDDKELEIVLDCGCQYCRKCVKNYTDNNSKCECGSKMKSE